MNSQGLCLKYDSKRKEITTQYCTFAFNFLRLIKLWLKNENFIYRMKLATKHAAFLTYFSTSKVELLGWNNSSYKGL